jgi:hypothetical protein
MTIDEGVDAANDGGGGDAVFFVSDDDGARMEPFISLA